MENKMNKIYLIIFILLLVLGCGYAPTEEKYNPDYTPEISVFSIISTDNHQEFVIVERTLRLNENDDKNSSKIIDDAEVFIISDTDTVQFTFYKNVQNYDYGYLRDGIYLDLYNEFIAEAGKTYQLVVNVPDGRKVTGSTTVPEIPEISQPAQWTVLQKETIEKTSIHWEDNPGTIGYSVNFLIGIEVSGSREKINILQDYYINDSPTTLTYIDAFLLFFEDDDFQLSNTATIKVIAFDQNSYDYLLKSDLASYIGTDLNILQGGIGAFGSFSVDSVLVRL
jgi:hypothetical protein